MRSTWSCRTLCAPEGNAGGITRRDLTKGLFVSALAAGIAPDMGAAAGESSVEALRLRLQAELDAHVRAGQPETALKLVHFDLLRTGFGGDAVYQASARVRLHWPPGFRQLSFGFDAPDPENATTGLRDGILTRFASLHPAGIALP